MSNKIERLRRRELFVFEFAGGRLRFAVGWLDCARRLGIKEVDLARKLWRPKGTSGPMEVRVAGVRCLLTRPGREASQLEEVQAQAWVSVPTRGLWDSEGLLKQVPDPLVRSHKGAQVAVAGLRELYRWITVKGYLTLQIPANHALISIASMGLKAYGGYRPRTTGLRDLAELERELAQEPEAMQLLAEIREGVAGISAARFDRP